MKQKDNNNWMSSGLQNTGQWIHLLFLIVIGGLIGLAIYGVKTWVDELKNPKEIAIEKSPIPFAAQKNISDSSLRNIHVCKF